LSCFQDLRLQPPLDDGVDGYKLYHAPSGGTVAYEPGPETVEAIATHMQKLTCLDMRFGRQHNLHSLTPLARLKQLRALCGDAPGLEAAACNATRKKLGLPGPLSDEDVRHWLSRPSEGW
jgi:hypothetical protein